MLLRLQRMQIVGGSGRETEADFIATKKTNFWLKRASAAMAKTKAMCIINTSNKLIGIQHEKKHGKGSKNSSTYFDNRIEIEQESKHLYINR